MRVALYARKSKENEAATDRQLDLARAFAEARGWTVVHTYTDQGVSGAAFYEHRPQFTAMLEDAKARRFDVVVTMSLDRFGRESIRTSHALLGVVEAGVKVYFYNDGSELTLDTPISKAMLSLQGFGAEDFRHQVRLRTREALRAKAKRGHVAGGRLFGYRNVKQNLSPDGTTWSHSLRVIVPEEAAVILRIFDMYIRGLGHRKIARQLTAEGVPTPVPQQGRRARWTGSSVREVLHRPTYGGVTIWGRTTWADRGGRKHKQKVAESKWEIIPSEALRIVPAETWDQAQGRLKAVEAQYARKRTTGRILGRPTTGIQSENLLVGLAQCGVCGGPITARTKGRGHGRDVYQCLTYTTRGLAGCTNSARMDRLETEAEVREHFAVLLQPDRVIRVIEATIAKLRPNLAEQDARQAVLTQELVKLEGQIARLADAIATGGHDEGLRAAVEEREQRRAQIRGEQAELVQVTQVAELDLPELTREIGGLLTEWRDWIGGHNLKARQILSKLVRGQLVFTPQTEADGRHVVEFTGLGQLEPILRGVIPLRSATALARVKDWCPRGDSNTRHAV